MVDYFKYIRYFAYSLEIIIFYALQRVPESIINLFLGLKIVYLIPLALIIAVFEGKRVGLVFGLIIGALLDLDSFFSLNFYTVVLATSAFSIGMVFKKNIKLNFLNAVVFTIIFMLIICVLETLFFAVFKFPKEFLLLFINFYLPKTGISALTVPVFYLFNKTIFSFISTGNQKVKDDE